MMTHFRKLHINDYKGYFGGGEKEWCKRGLLQLDILQKSGLQPYHTLLDMGCGPLRGGVHFISYLNANNYYGVDCNSEFIAYAKKNSDKQKNAKFKISCEFDSFHIKFDFILCFSVLNHCTEKEINLFLKKIPEVSHVNTKIIITHADKFLHVFKEDVFKSDIMCLNDLNYSEFSPIVELSSKSFLL